MDLQTHKIEFLTEYLRINDEELIVKVSNFLRRERRKKNKNLLPFTMLELEQKLARSEQSIADGRVFTQSEVESILKNRGKNI